MYPDPTALGRSGLPESAEPPAGGIREAGPVNTALLNTSFLNDFLSAVAERGRALLEMRRQRGLSSEPVTELLEALISERGEASGVAIAREVLSSWERLDSEGRDRFFRTLTERFGADAEALARAIAAYEAEPGARTAAALHSASAARREELIRRLNLAPGGTGTLIRMREDLLGRLRANPDFALVDRDFERLFTSWFNRGFLEMHRIDWSTPAAILEKIIRYEAVHPIHGWDDLRRRVDVPDRRCYAFFHPALPDEPLIFVEVALTREIPGAITPILAQAREVVPPQEATTAVFYSISNCQAGLRGISFGHFLIKQVVEELVRDLRDLKTFVTLSPVPGFAGWVARLRRDEATPLLTPETRTALEALDDPAWAERSETTEALKKVLMPLAASYFLSARTTHNRPVDPVARFHLGNGARLERLNWLGDTSPKGLAQSFGLMVNYLYRPQEIETNHEAYVTQGTVAVASAVRKLAPKGVVSEPALVPLGV